MPTTELTQSLDPQFAVFNGSDEITETMYKEVLSFTAHVQELEKQKTAPANRSGWEGNMNRVTFTVKCRINQFRNEKFYVDYLKHDGVWIPMPIQVCDNGDNCTDCQECVSDIIKQARQTKPPFAE